MTSHVFKKPVFYECYRIHLLGIQGEELGDRTWENESTTWKGYDTPPPSYMAFFFHLKKTQTPQICYRRKYTGRKGRKERRNGGREEGRRGEQEERTKRGGKKGMRRRALWCLTDTSWRLWVIKVWFTVQSSRLCSCSWAELLSISSHMCSRTGHRIQL